VIANVAADAAAETHRSATMMSTVRERDKGGVGGMLSPACCGDAEVIIVFNHVSSKDGTSDGIPATGELSGDYGEHFGDLLIRICRNDMEIPPAA